jgi:diguanylate cyclase (GGDEF)-like protein
MTEILWVLLHSLTGVAAGLWCRRIASKERVAARDLPARSRFRMIVGFHVLVVISMPLWFTGFSSDRQISIEVAAALVSAVVMMVMTAPDRAFAYATLCSAAVCGAIGLDTLYGVATPFRVLAWVAVVVGFAPLIEAVHRPQRRSIELIIENEQLVSELQIANTTLAEQVERDSLTGIGNRVLVDSFLDTPRLVGLLMIDIDHFKTVNDRDGHAAGDAVLRSVGALLDKCCREGDVVARLGGDEFVMLLDGASLDDVETIAQRLRDDAAELLASHGVTLSIGGTIGNLELETSDDLLARADANLYSAKGSGRDRAVIAR